MATPIIFRQFVDGTPIAIFPEHEAGLPCMTFTENGGFGEANYDSCVKFTKPVNAPTNLIKALREHGYRDLRIYKKMQGWMIKVAAP